EAVVAIIGLWEAGCVPVPVSPMLTDAEIAFIAADCGAALMFPGVPEPRRSRLRAMPGTRVRAAPAPATPALATQALAAGQRPAPSPSDAAESPGADVLLQYTSGSTGVPKGVRQSLGGLLAILDGFGTAVPLRPDDVVLSTAKLSFGYGFGSSLL